MANQWHASVQTNVERMNAMIKGSELIHISGNVSKLYLVVLIFVSMSFFYFCVTGLVSECNTVGSLNCSGMKHLKQEASSTDATVQKASSTDATVQEASSTDATVQKASSTDATVQEASSTDATVTTGGGAAMKPDGEVGSPKEDVVDFEALYNCVVYGLPHITLVPPTA